MFQSGVVHALLEQQTFAGHEAGVQHQVLRLGGQPGADAGGLAGDLRVVDGEQDPAVRGVRRASDDQGRDPARPHQVRGNAPDGGVRPPVRSVGPHHQQVRVRLPRLVQEGVPGPAEPQSGLDVLPAVRVPAGPGAQPRPGELHQVGIDAWGQDVHHADAGAVGRGERDGAVDGFSPVLGEVGGRQYALGWH